MRYMLIVKATAASEAGIMPEPAVMAAMAEFHQELARAGVLLDANGLRPSSEGWRVHHRGGERHIVDGPFAETKELIAGYTMIEVRSREEALEWSRRFPTPPDGCLDVDVEVRRLYEMDDFGKSDATDCLRQIHGIPAAV